MSKQKQSHSGRRLAAILLAALAFPVAADGSPAESNLLPRRPFDSQALTQRAASEPTERIVLKFHQGTRVRLHDQVLQGHALTDRDRTEMMAVGLSTRVVDDDLKELQYRLATTPSVQGIRRLLSTSVTELEERKLLGERRSGKQLADLNLFFRIDLVAGTTAVEVQPLLERLMALPSVEIAYLPGKAIPAGGKGSSPGRGAPVCSTGQTPDFQPLQGYLEPAPVGIDAYHAWTFAGGTGDGVKVIDVEYGAHTDHEDFPPFFYIDSVNAPNTHGMGVMGILVGQHNGFGVAGIVPDALIGIESTLLESDEDAIQTALTIAGSEGVVLLEIQIPGPTVSCDPCSSSQCNYVPVEWEPAVFALVETATALGTIVVEAAGNGGTDLDDPSFLGAFDRSVRDSGAILVGASRSDARIPMCWSNYGSRLDLHAWGDNIVTTGHPPNLQNQSGVLCDYTNDFGGTSGASPIVTGAATSLRAAALANGQGAPDPRTIRQLLADTGTPQANPILRNIGPMPDLEAAFDALIGPANQPPVANPDVLALGGCSKALTFPTSALTANDSDPNGDPLEPPCAYTMPHHGSLESFPTAFRYTPNAELCTFGTDSFQYTIFDRPGCTGLSAEAWATVAPQLGGPALLEDFFESGDLSAWSGTFTSGSASIDATADAALHGGFGLEVALGGGPHAFVYDDRPELERHYHASFLFDPAAVDLAGMAHVLFSGIVPGVGTVFQMRLRRTAEGAYQVILDTWDDSGSFVTLPAWVDLATGRQRLEVEWRAATSAGSDDGLIRLHLNALAAGETLGLDNDEAVVEQVRLGALAASASASGSYYLDDFRSYRDQAAWTGLFGDTFESGTVAWDGSWIPHGGSLQAVPTAGLTGSFGLQVEMVAGGTQVFLLDDSPADEALYRAFFRLDPNGLPMASEVHIIAAGQSATQAVWQVQMRKSGGSYQVRLFTWQDDQSVMAVPQSDWVTLVDGQANSIGIEWQADTGGIVAGVAALWVNGQISGQVVGLANGSLRIEKVLFGSVGSATTPGTFYLDDFRSWRPPFSR